MTLRFLIVEDDPTTRNGLAHAVTQLCSTFYVTTACRGQEGLYLMSTEPFHVVLYDCAMPDMAGTRLLKEVQRRSLNVLVYLTTTRDDAKARAEAIQLGASGVFGKPVPRAQLAAIIDEAIQKFSSSQQES